MKSYLITLTRRALLAFFFSYTAGAQTLWVAEFEGYGHDRIHGDITHKSVYYGWGDAAADAEVSFDHRDKDGNIVLITGDCRMRYRFEIDPSADRLRVDQWTQSYRNGEEAVGSSRLFMRRYYTVVGDGSLTVRVAYSTEGLLRDQNDGRGWLGLAGMATDTRGKILSTGGEDIINLVEGGFVGNSMTAHHGELTLLGTKWEMSERNTIPAFYYDIEVEPGMTVAVDTFVEAQASVMDVTLQGRPASGEARAAFYPWGFNDATGRPNAGRVDLSVSVLSGSGEFVPLENVASGPNVVIAEVEQAIAVPGGAQGKWRLTRSGSNTLPLTVEVALSGTAAAHPARFAFSPALESGNSLTFPAGQSVLDVYVSALDDGLNQPDQDLALRVLPGDGYQAPEPIGPQVVHIVGAPLVTVTASNPTAYEQGPWAGAFSFTRSSKGPLDDALLVAFRLSGTAAVDGTDYAVSGAESYDPQSGEGTIRFAAGESMATLSITPLADRVQEDDETVVCELMPQTGYIPSNPTSAEVVIEDYTVITVLVQSFYEGFAFPLEGKTIHFEPMNLENAGSYRYYAGYISDAVGFPTAVPDSLDASDWEAAGWSVWQNPEMGGSWTIVQNFQFMGMIYNRAYINANGTISFLSPNDASAWSWGGHFTEGRPQFSGYWADLDPSPSGGGLIAHKYIMDGDNSRHVVTFFGVPRQGSTQSVYFQIELVNGGPVRLTHWGSDATAGTVVGISDGNGWPSSWEMTNFTALPTHPNLPSGFLGWASQLPEHGRGLMDQPFHDGIPNVLRYAFGLRRDGPAVLPDFTAPQGSAHLFEFVLSPDTNADGFQMIVELSPDMVNWVPFAEAAETEMDLVPEGFQVKITPNQGWPLCFFRIGVQPADGD